MTHFFEHTLARRIRRLAEKAGALCPALLALPNLGTASLRSLCALCQSFAVFQSATACKASASFLLPIAFRLLP